MSDTASLEVSRELFELSGWDGTYHVHYYKEDLTAFDASGWHVNSRMKVHQDYIPAYDAGYLLRKLPQGEIRNRAGRYSAWMNNDKAILPVYADTPEDALCKLAIELIKAGILPISGRDL